MSDGASAHARLLRALHALPRGAGPQALRPLHGAFEDALLERLDHDVSLAHALVRVLGPVMGEATPATLEDAAALATGVDRATLLAQLPRLHGALLALRDAGLLARTTPVLTRRAVQALALAQDALAQALGLRARDVLASAVHDASARLARELSLHTAPIPIPAERALDVARWWLGDGPPPPDAALLTLARALDALCARAPLGGPALASLRTLVAAADAERGTPSWDLVAARLALLLPRLLPRPAVPPLYRTHVPAAPRPDSLQAQLAAWERGAPP